MLLKVLCVFIFSIDPRVSIIPCFFCQFHYRLLFFSTCDRILFPLGGPDSAWQNCVVDQVFTLFPPWGFLRLTWGGMIYVFSELQSSKALLRAIPSSRAFRWMYFPESLASPTLPQKKSTNCDWFMYDCCDQAPTVTQADPGRPGPTRNFCRPVDWIRRLKPIEAKPGSEEANSAMSEFCVTQCFTEAPGKPNDLFLTAPNAVWMYGFFLWKNWWSVVILSATKTLPVFAMRKVEIRTHTCDRSLWPNSIENYNVS